MRRDRSMLRRLVPLEEHEQALYFRWLLDVTIKDLGLPEAAPEPLRPHCYAVANQKGTRSDLDVMRLAAQGVTAGAHDINVDVPSGPYHGLRLEAKRRKGGRVSTEQQAMIEHRRRMQYQSLVGEGFDELRLLTKQYLTLSWRVFDRWNG